MHSFISCLDHAVLLQQSESKTGCISRTSAMDVCVRTHTQCHVCISFLSICQNLGSSWKREPQLRKGFPLDWPVGISVGGDIFLVND